MIQYEVLRDNIPYEQLFALMKESFHEREEQGLDFTVIHFTLENLKKALKGLPVIVAYEEISETGEKNYVGFQPIYIENKSATAGILAVSSQCKRKGIGTKIEEITEKVAIDAGCDFMRSNTSEEAISSVNWHLKNGYVKSSISSSCYTNYYTVFFRKYFKYHWLWSNKVLSSAYFSLFEQLYKHYRNKDGSLTKIGTIIHRFIDVIK